MKRYRLLLLILVGMSASAWADSQRCYDMYPIDAYTAEERNTLIQECLAAYAPEPQYQEEEGSSEPTYYEGTVEDFVNDTPAE